MQNKGIIKLFAILFGLVSIYQLSFTFKANQIEEEAKNAAIAKFADTEDDYQTKRNLSEVRYIDSLKTEKIKVGEEFEPIEVYNLGVSQYTYSEVEKNAMKLGLDLKGGINAIIQISVKDILKGLTNNSKDPVFNKALEDAEELQKDAQESYLESFFRAFDAIKGDTKLASPDIFANRDLSDVIKFDMSDDEVKGIIETKIDESIESAFEVLRNRIDGFGVSSPNIQRLGNSGRILIELPGAKDKKRVIELMTTTAQLQFWETYKNQDVVPYILQVNQALVEANKAKETPENDEVAEAGVEQDSTSNAIDELTGQIATDSTDVAETNPLGIQGYGGGSVVGVFLAKDKEKVLSHLNDPKNRATLPAEMRYIKFVWGIQEKDSEYSELYAIKTNRDVEPPLSGSVITDARQDYDQLSRPAVSMQMNAKGAKIWEEMTKKAYETQGYIAIVLDNIVYSAPSVSTGPIAGGNSQISGAFSLTEAVDLANVLRAGKLPASAEIVQAEEIGPSLGQEAIDSGMKSFLIALAFVLLWMIFYYGKAGIFADVALLFNILLIFGVLASLGAVLTLPGIAGIVLTIGISVDANVLIFERIREELAKGKSQKESIKDGFSNALSSILDANITTGLTALILFVFGTGPIKGFATTLIIGILTSLFTAIFITRLLIDWWIGRGGKLDFSTAMTKGLFNNVNINFLKKRKIAYVISGVFIIVSIGSLFTNKLDQGIDFVGGRTYQVRFEQPVSIEEVKGDLNAVFNSSEVKTIGGDNQLKISTKYKVEENSTEVDEEVQSKLFGALQKYLPDGMTYQEFLDGSGEGKIGKMSSSKVSPTIADDIKKSSFWAVLGSLVVVFLYILFRFKKWQFSLGAVAAVFHDVLIVLGIFSLTWKFMPFSMEIDQAFIAAILTVIGYSLNDTVVVFDRIREFLNEHTSWKLDKTINASLNSTLSRTLNTSVTTLVVLLAMFAFGADSLRGLLFALIVGVVVGTYSSMFIATPLMYDTAKKGDAAESLKKKVKEEDEA
ncbi:protein translocase subunit SecDF [Winogradskyella echinorum]|uniref:Multifunctional fusion protein n=1 Tax=Winogradskyella echinorum TaxID=538189 RepID=A0ABR6Y4U3_9FLAO|nr:protein translocase subunit SecDF [Winogradskyella echinorum]MBC3847710.1 protein translocase subunit SecDF [Winogradskyella echinorum]MBC5752058.1 protein translocase subunit SecDF [Winogradskyella echinorum]